MAAADRTACPERHRANIYTGTSNLRTRECLRFQPRVTFQRVANKNALNDTARCAGRATDAIRQQRFENRGSRRALVLIHRLIAWDISNSDGFVADDQKVCNTVPLIPGPASTNTSVADFQVCPYLNIRLESRAHSAAQSQRFRDSKLATASLLNFGGRKGIEKVVIEYLLDLLFYAKCRNGTASDVTLDDVQFLCDNVTRTQPGWTSCCIFVLPRSR
ncbi:hypothetical protein EDB89DRAFT_1913417, partial [Lactarius sanguifluus]